MLPIARSEANVQTNVCAIQNFVEILFFTSVINELLKSGMKVRDENIAHLSPAPFEHINPYGRYRFDMERELDPNSVRPLRPCDPGGSLEISPFLMQSHPCQVAANSGSVPIWDQTFK